MKITSIILVLLLSISVQLYASGGGEEQYIAQAKACLKQRSPDLRGYFKAYQKAAQFGDPEAIYELAQLHSIGFGCKVDADKALELHQQNAVSGHKESALCAGILLYQRQQYGKARPLLEQAAAGGQAEAKLILSIMYLHGQGVNASEQKHLALMKQAAQEGSARAQEQVGLYHQSGRFGKIDMQAARDNWRAALVGDNKRSAYYLGMMYRYPRLGDRQREKLARYYFKEAALESIAAAQYELGLCYLLSIGGEKNATVGFEYIADAAMQGEPRALQLISLSYVLGWGNKASRSNALYWMLQVAGK